MLVVPSGLSLIANPPSCWLNVRVKQDVSAFELYKGDNIDMSCTWMTVPYAVGVKNAGMPEPPERMRSANVPYGDRIAT